MKKTIATESVCCFMLNGVKETFFLQSALDFFLFLPQMRKLGVILQLLQSLKMVFSQSN